MKKNKFTKYTSTVGALLAVSGGAHAVIQPGTIIKGPDGDAILDHDGDEVLFDLDNDGNPDFIAVALIDSSYLSYFGSIYYSYQSFGLVAYTYGNFVELNSFSTYFFLGSPKLKKFNMNDVVGPLSYSFYGGIITKYSIPVGDPIPTTTPPGTFEYTNDQGYVGIQMVTDSGIKYGWIDVHINSTGNEVGFTGCALEYRPNDPIVAGNSVPVPLLPIASAAGLGLVGLMTALKKRKKSKKKQKN